jgi:hypothetical protein
MRYGKVDDDDDDDKVRWSMKIGREWDPGKEKGL